MTIIYLQNVEGNFCKEQCQNVECRVINTVSSAYMAKSALGGIGISFKKILNSMGPNILYYIILILFYTILGPMLLLV